MLIEKFLNVTLINKQKINKILEEKIANRLHKKGMSNKEKRFRRKRKREVQGPPGIQPSSLGWDARMDTCLSGMSAASSTSSVMAVNGLPRGTGVQPRWVSQALTWEEFTHSPSPV